MAHQLPVNLVNETQGIMVGIANWANTVTYGYFWAMVLFLFSVILFIATSRYTTSRAFGFAGVTALLGALMLLTLNLISWWMASIFILAGIGGIVSMILGGKE